jgi:predicted LPLAT superfamily acyltransferase
MSGAKPAGAAWLQQQEKSNIAILKLMVWISLTFGRAIGRVVLYGIAGYYVLFAPKARRFSRAYLSRALGRWRNGRMVSATFWPSPAPSTTAFTCSTTVSICSISKSSG